jgi:hypothetical protein
MNHLVEPGDLRSGRNLRRIQSDQLQSHGKDKSQSPQTVRFSDKRTGSRTGCAPAKFRHTAVVACDDMAAA